MTSNLLNFFLIFVSFYYMHIFKYIAEIDLQMLRLV